MTLLVFAVAVAVPPQVLVKPDGVLTTSPEGKTTANAMPTSGREPLGLVIVKVSAIRHWALSLRG
jgi:hypothetical protein